MTEFIAFDYCGWNDHYGRFTHSPSNETLVCRPGMGQHDWDLAQLEFFKKFADSIKVYDCSAGGAYSPSGPELGTVEQICLRLKNRVS